MSSCSQPDCTSKQYLWMVSSSQGDTPPVIKDFTVCQTHLQTSEKMKDIYNALLVARYNGEYGNSVCQNGYKLEKIMDTWLPKECYKCDDCGKLKPSDSTYKCSKCGNSEKLWHYSGKKWVTDEEDCYPYGYYESFGEYLCDSHVDKNHKNKVHMNNTEYSSLKTFEATWTNSLKRTTDSKQSKSKKK